MTKEEHLWTVFVPYQFLVLSNGQLYGKVNRKVNRIYIVGLGSNNITNGSRSSEDIIGQWSCDFQGKPNYRNTNGSNKNRNLWLRLYSCNTGKIDCLLHVGDKRMHVNCILFNPHNILESYFLQNQSALNEPVENDIIKPLISYSNVACNNLQQDETYIGKLKKTVNNIQISNNILQFWTILYSILTIAIDNRYTQAGILKNLTEIPAFCQHLNLKKKILFSTKNSDNRLFKTQNVVSQMILDVFLGILVMTLLMQDGITESISTQFFMWTEKVANELDILLNWLMGAPAGLKLNKPLTEFLGHFFMYHIYLWKGYLLILKQVFSTVLWFASCVGVLGLSAQICLLQDIVSITTLHIYCYYVYAARLYRLQVYVLSSLWRLFRGKKWNVLRHRVDSASFDVDQLFVGTLLFTIFLFLLPTTGLYYIVFTLLRMVVLLFQGSLSTVVYMVNHIPLYTIMLWILGSSKVSGDISLDVVPSDVPTQTKVYTLQVHKIPLYDLMKMATSNLIDTTSQPALSWKHFLLNLFKGHLVYPWIDLHKESS